MRRTLLCGLLLLMTATSAVDQVRVDVRLEKARSLAGEPVVAIVQRDTPISTPWQAIGMKQQTDIDE
jgi:hypothetical protein